MFCRELFALAIIVATPVARCRRWLTLVSYVISTFYIAEANAWEFDEHEIIGAESYKKACSDLLTENLSLKEREILQSVACGNVIERSLVYGQATAIAGDHIADPDDFLTKFGVLKALSFRTYALEALKNSAHFHPEAPRVWRHFHAEAIAEAIRAHGERALLQRRRRFETAFYLHAYADHFLHDSFSAGHGGFARVASQPNASVAIHDYFNRHGRIFVDGEHRRWYAYGDGHLDLGKHAIGRQLLLTAATLSVRAFLRAFITSNPENEETGNIVARFPVLTNGLHATEACTISLSGVPHCSYDSHIEPLSGIQREAYVKSEYGIRMGIYKWGTDFTDYPISPALLAEYNAIPLGRKARLGGKMGILSSIEPTKAISELLLELTATYLVHYKYPSPFSYQVFVSAGIGRVHPPIDPEDRRYQGKPFTALVGEYGIRIDFDFKYAALQLTCAGLVTTDRSSTALRDTSNYGFAVTLGFGKVLSVAGGSPL